VDYLQIARLMGAGKVPAKPISNEELIAAIDELMAGGGALAQPPIARSAFWGSPLSKPAFALAR
jgi:hypothetical protein